jgi:succinate dehydrogenase / fumarate reductase membrane anchor subunit
MGRINSVEQRKGTVIGEVRGLGSAHTGAHHWLMVQFTSAASLLTCAYLVISLILLPDMSYDAVRAWVSQPVTALALGLMIVAVFWHTRVGVEVLIADYVDQPGNKFAATLLLNFAVFIGAGYGLLSLVRLVLGSAA